MKSFSEREVGVTERPRSLNQIKAIVMPSVLSLFILALSAHARCMTWHGVACGFARVVRMRRNN